MVSCPFEGVCFLLCFFGAGLILCASHRHFNGEESFDTGPMAPPSEPPAGVNPPEESGRSGAKL